VRSPADLCNTAKGQPKQPVHDRKTTRYLSLADFMTNRFGPSATPVKRLGTKRCKELRERGHTPVRQADFDRAKAEYHALQGDPAYRRGRP
jgi:hypothetical protein